jgi:hypothetical protein
MPPRARRRCGWLRCSKRLSSLPSGMLSVVRGRADPDVQHSFPNNTSNGSRPLDRRALPTGSCDDVGEVGSGFEPTVSTLITGPTPVLDEVRDAAQGPLWTVLG